MGGGRGGRGVRRGRMATSRFDGGGPGSDDDPKNIFYCNYGIGRGAQGGGGSRLKPSCRRLEIDRVSKWIEYTARTPPNSKCPPDPLFPLLQNHTSLLQL